MGSPLGPALTNIFIIVLKINGFKLMVFCTNDFKSVFYKRYIDNIFALFSSPYHADEFKEYVI